MIDMNNFKPLKQSEIKINIEKFKNGNIEARDNLIFHYAKKVDKIIKRKYANYDQDELFQVGIVAIIDYLNSCYEKDINIIERTINRHIETNINFFINNKMQDKWKENNIIENIEVNGFDDLINMDYVNQINNIIKNFNPRYQDFFNLYLYHNYRQTDIANMYGTTRNYINAVMGHKIKRIKEIIDIDYIDFDSKPKKKNNSNNIKTNKLDNFEKPKPIMKKEEYIIELLKKDYDIEIINLALKQLKRKNIDYNYYNYSEIKDYLIYEIIKIINELIQRKGTIYEFFLEYKKQDIDNIIYLLPKADKQLLEFAINNKSNEILYNMIITQLVKNIKNILLKKDSIYNHRKNTIYENFEDYSEEEIDCILNLIDPNDKLKIVLYYSKPFLKNYLEEDLKNIIKTISKELELFSIIYRQKFVMYNYFGKYCKSEIINIIDYLPEEDKTLLFSIFGEDLNKTRNKNIDNYTILKIYSIIKKIEESLYNKYQKKKVLK